MDIDILKHYLIYSILNFRHLEVTKCFSARMQIHHIIFVTFEGGVSCQDLTALSRFHLSTSPTLELQVFCFIFFTKTAQPWAQRMHFSVKNEGYLCQCSSHKLMLPKVWYKSILKLSLQGQKQILLTNHTLLLLSEH